MISDTPDFLQRFRDGYSGMLEHVPRVLADPRAYQRESLILALMGALLLVLIVLAVFALADTFKAGVKRRALSSQVRRRDRWVPPVLAIGAVALLVFLLAISPMIPSVGRACSSCHQIEVAVESWENGVHSGQSCYACHVGSTVGEAFGATVLGVARSVAGTSAVSATGVFSSACLGCHDDVVDGVIGEEIRVRHSDIIEVGMPCMSCHVAAGHEDGKMRSIQRSTMSVCLTCHDNVTASSECDVCHADHPLDTAATPAVAGATPIAVTCAGCHSQALERQCVECHGLEMPHPQEFMSQHAGLSDDNSAMCTKCHALASTTQGCGCHEDVNLHGTYSEWFPRHGTAALASGPMGCNCHKQAFCAFCHTSDPFAHSR